MDEADETFAVQLSAPVRATIADGTGTGTIIDDDPTPTLRVNDVTVTEGAASTTKKAAFRVTLSAVSGRAVSVRFATANATATAPGDYAAASGTATVPAGATGATVAVTVKGDGAKEANETFRVNLSSPTNATIADAQGTGTITNDD